MMKEIPDNTAGAIVLTGHLRAKRPGESARNAGAFIVAQGMLTPGALATIGKEMVAASAKAEQEEDRMYR
jgi:hypothetical protein